MPHFQPRRYSFNQGGITPHKQSLLCCVKTHRKPFRAQAPLAIPKLWRRYSRASYIPCPLRGKGLGKRGGAPFGKGDGGIRKNTFFNGKEGRDDFRNSFTHFIRDRYNLSYNVSNWIHETNDDIKPLDMHAKPF